MLNEYFSYSYQENYRMFQDMFKENADITFREFIFDYDKNVKACCMYIDGLNDTNKIDTIIKELNGLLKNEHEINTKNIMDEMKNHLLSNAQVKMKDKVQDAVDGFLTGDCLLFLDQSNKAMILSTKGGETRSVAEPQSEQVVRGPRDGFVESIRANTSLVRRRIRDPYLKIEGMKIGEKSKTDINIIYLEGTVKEGLVEEVKNRLKHIKIDAILDSGYIEELITDAPYSPFTTIMSTERPDKVASAVYEGRVAILADNSPTALIVPATFWQFLQASDDYYFGFLTGSVFRIIRFIAFVISLILPSIFVMLVSFHQEMIPTGLALTIASGREVTPFPVLLEALLMELVFELMREAGLRMPKQVGQAVSIVGSLVIGQAAVQAGLVSPPMVIIVALTGIASFAIPNFSASFAIRLIRFPLLIASGTLGLLGFAVMFTILTIHALSIRSFGEPFIAPAAPFQPSDQKDTLIRAPWWSMQKNAAVAEGKDIRAENDLKPEPPKKDDEMKTKENGDLTSTSQKHDGSSDNKNVNQEEKRKGSPKKKKQRKKIHIGGKNEQ